MSLVPPTWWVYLLGCVAVMTRGMAQFSFHPIFMSEPNNHMDLVCHFSQRNY